MQVKNLNNNIVGIKTHPTNKTSFKGFARALGDFNQKAMNKLEKGGFFAEFVTLDLIGLVLPRVYQGFQRNKEELGHLNYQAGTEEFLREFITGPSLFLIPISLVILAGKALGKAVQINSKVFNKFTETFKSLNPASVKDADVAKNQENFVKKLFNDLFVNNKSVQENNLTNVAKAYEKDFTEQIVESLGKEGKDLKKARGSFVELIAKINASLFPNRKNTLGIEIPAGTKTHVSSAVDLFDDTRKYVSDVIPSVKLTIEDAIKNSKETIENVVKDSIDKISQVRINGRKLLCIGGTTALAAFLSIIPIIYQRSKSNPALAGLVKDDQKEAKKC